jgi:hypothetical protein
MQLSEAEKKGIRIGGGDPSRAKQAGPQAIGKVLAEKPVSVEGLAAALGKIWCPIKGVMCRDLGDNHFLFTFLYASGKRRALDDGPWMFGKDLIVLADYDETKVLEEMEFFIPIWVRAMKMPLGEMNREVGAAIG